MMETNIQQQQPVNKLKCQLHDQNRSKKCQKNKISKMVEIFQNRIDSKFD